MKREIATFGAGCFWGVEYTFSQVRGVVKTDVGFMGGATRNPSYKDVCTDETMHAEVVRVEFEPAVVSYEKLLKVFWAIHDPTQKNRQGVDVGTQYRSTIFFYSEEQQKQAVLSLKKHEKKLGKKIVTEIAPASEFYRAEAYHQKYYEKRGGGAACHVVPTSVAE